MTLFLTYVHTSIIFISCSLNLKFVIVLVVVGVMENFLKRSRPSHEQGSSSQHVSCNLEELPSDPGKRPKMSTYHPNDQEKIRRKYAMKIVKSRLRNQMGDELMNDCLVTYTERDVVDKIDDELIIQRFQYIQPRRGHL